MSGSRLRIAAFATHPVQYNAPWFRAIEAEDVSLRVLFALLPDERQQATGFEAPFAWDVPLLQGYEWKALRQRRRRPTLDAFWGLSAASVGRELADYSPDVVLLTGWNAWPLLQALRAAVQLGLPTVVRGESNGLEARSAWKRGGHRLLLSWYDAFVGIGKANRAFYESNGVAPQRIVDGGYFVDEEFFAEAAARETPRRGEWRRYWSIPAGACCFVFAGKLQEKKRPLDFLHAIAEAASRLPPGKVHGLVVGSGHLMAEARELATTLRAPVTFTGFLNQGEIGRAYAASDVLILPSDWGETWGLVVNEAMLFGLPAVVSDRVGCGPDLVEDGETGHVVPFGDVRALAERVIRLVEAPADRGRMGRLAQQRVRDYSPRRGARATVAAAKLAMGSV